MIKNEKRDKLITDNIDIVKRIAARYSEKTGIEASELESYGYEGLINAVDNFNHLSGSLLQQYFYPYITNNINKGIRIIDPKYYYENIVKRDIESLPDDLTNKIYLNKIDSLTQYKNNLMFSEDNIFYKASQNLIKEEVYKLIDSCLTTWQKTIIIERFGLKDGDIKSVKEIAHKYCRSFSNIYITENYALNKLRNLAINTKELKSLLEIYDEHNENNYTQYQMVKK